jgi:hypothetical protein
MSEPIEVRNTTQPLPFLLVSSADHITGATGKTPTVTIRKNDGGAFATPAGAVTEVGVGWYQVAANATDANTLGPLLLHATAAGCDPADIRFDVVPNLAALAAALSPSSTSALALTARTLITNALIELGVLADGEVPSAAMLSLGLATLNRMLDAWNTERLLLPVQTRSSYTLTASLASPTIGPTGTFSASRPMAIEQMGVMPVGSTVELPVLPMTRGEYAAITLKTLTMDWPLRYLYEPGTPNGTITFYPIPTTAATLYLYVLTALASFATYDTAYTFQPGYYEALHFNLALRCMRPFGVKFDGPDLALLIDQAGTAKGSIKRQNEVPLNLPIDVAVLGSGAGGMYDIYSDTNY